MSFEKPRGAVEEKEKPKEKFSSIERVLGSKGQDISKEEREEVFRATEEIFKNQKKYKEELIKEYESIENIPEVLRVIFFEREKKDEEVYLINHANRLTNQLRNNFNKPDLNIPADNIHIIPSDVNWPKELGDNTESYYISLGQLIVLREPEIKQLKNSKTIFLKNLIHEMIHFKSYGSIKRLENSSEYNVYRSGLKSFKRENEFIGHFGILDEGVVEELTIKAIEDSKDLPLIKNEFEQTKRYKKVLEAEKTEDGQELINGDELFINFDQDEESLQIVCNGKVRERKILNQLIEKIYEKNQSQYKNKNEIFEVFVTAEMTGKIIKLGRLLDKSFGKKTFRKIADIGEDIDELESFINKLK